MLILHCGDYELAVSRSDRGFRHLYQGLETAQKCLAEQMVWLPKMIYEEKIKQAFTNHEIIFNALRICIKNGIIKSDDVEVRFHQEDGFISMKIHETGQLNEWPDGFFDGWDKSLDQLLS